MTKSDRWLALWPKRYFYGWAIVGVAMSVNFTQVGEFNPVLAIFIRPLNEEFGWTRAEMSGAIAIGSIWGALMAPLAGPILDRRGPRIVLVLGQILFGGAMLAAAFIQELWQFYVTYNFGRAVVLGVTSLGVSVAVANWFQRDRAMAISIAQLGTRIGMAVLPLAVQVIIVSYGWRWGFAFLGIMVWVTGVIPSFLFLRRRPEDLGLLPDGRPFVFVSRELGAMSKAAPVEEVSWTLAEARRTPALWLLTLSTSFGFLVAGGINLHMVPYFMDQGIPALAAVAASTVFAISAGVGSLVWGWLARRFTSRLTLAVLFLLAGAAIVLILTVRTATGAYVVAFVYGSIFGGWLPLANSLWGDFFGRRSLGAITGFVAPFQLVANASGPFMAGMLYDNLGDYMLAFSLYAASYVVAGGWLLLAHPPRHRGHREADNIH